MASTHSRPVSSVKSNSIMLFAAPLTSLCVSSTSSGGTSHLRLAKKRCSCKVVRPVSKNGSCRAQLNNRVFSGHSQLRTSPQLSTFVLLDVPFENECMLMSACRRRTRLRESD